MSSYINTEDKYLDQEETITNSSATGKPQTIIVDDTMGPDAGVDNHRTLSGDFNDAEKATVTGGRDVINATGQVLQNATILGDANNLNASTFTGGADKITLGSVASDDAFVIGDATTVNGGSTRGGNDTIIVEGAVTGGTIIGDVQTITNTTFIAGNDNIHLRGNVDNANIYTDTDGTVSSGINTLSGGIDIVTLGIAPTMTVPTLTTVTNTNIDLGHGNDVLTAHSSIDHDTNIDGGAGNDKFILDTMNFTDVEEGNTSSVIDGEAGNDTFSVKNLLAGDVIGGAGNDSFTIVKAGDGNRVVNLSGDAGSDKFIITNANNASIKAGADDDTINISDTAIDSTLLGNTGNDNITVKNLNSGSVIHGNEGNDNIKITTMNTTKVYGDDHDDKITVTNNMGGDISGGTGKDFIDITNLTSVIVANDVGYATASVDGGEDDDTIKVTNTTGATIYGGTGDDTITITNVQHLYESDGSFITRSLIDAGDGNDSIVVTNVFGRIIGGSDDDTIRVTKTADSTDIYGSEGHDNISVINAINSTNIYGGDGEDKITVTNLKDSSKIDGYIDNDSITVTTAINSTILGDAGNDNINVSSTATNTNIDAGDDDDTITVKTLSANSTLYGGLGDDSIKVINLTDSQIFGYQPTELANEDSGADSIAVTTMTNSQINAGAGDNEVKIGTIKGESNSLDMGAGNDYLSITTNSKSNLTEDNFVTALGSGNDTLQVNWDFNGNFISSKTADEDDGDTLITKGLGQFASFEFGTDDDGLIINGTLNRNIFDSDADNMGEGNDSLFVSAKTTAVSDTMLAKALGTVGHDTLQVNWAFNGIFEAGTDGAVLISKGLTATSSLNFANGDDGFISTAAISGTAFNPRYINTHAGQDTIELVSSNYVNINTSGGDGAINDNDSVVIKTAANGSIYLGSDDDYLSIASTATNMQINAGEGTDTVSLGGMNNSKLTFDAAGSDDISIKGTFNAGMAESIITNPNEPDPDAPTLPRVSFDGLATDNDGGSITIDTWGSGQLSFGDGDDTLIVNKAINGSLATPKVIYLADGNNVAELYSANHTQVFGGTDNDTITIKNTLSNSFIFDETGDDVVNVKSVTNSLIDLGIGTDKAIIGSLGTGAALIFDADGSDSISIGGTYNTGTVVSSYENQITSHYENFYGLATGHDGGSITLDTLGTGKLTFGDGADTLTINKALSGTLGLKDIFMQAGDDSIILNTVNGAVISGGDSAQGNPEGGGGGYIISSDDYISATGLGATGVLNGDGGADTIQIGRQIDDIKDFKTTATMSNGIINGGDGYDTIYIGNTHVENTNLSIKGTLSGGKVYGGDGEDLIMTTTLSGTGFIDGGAGHDRILITNINGGTINGDAGADNIIFTNINKGTINAGDDNDFIGYIIPSVITSMNGGTINAGFGNDNIVLTNLKGGVINTDDGRDNVTITTMTGGTINSSAADIIAITNMNGGSINDSNDAVDKIGANTMTKGTINANGGNDGISVVNMKGGTINGGDGADTIDITTTMDGGAVNGQDGDDSLTVVTLNGGTIHLGEGDNQITINDSLNGGKIIGGTGNDTLILSDGIKLGAGYSIDLGAGENKIQVQSNLDGQALTLGASNDNVFLDKNVQNAKISLGNGNDTIITSDQDMPVTTTNTVIDTGTGNDRVNLENATDGTIIYAGTGDDHITLQNSSNSVVDLGTGNNYIKAAGTASNVVIIGGSGNDTVTINGSVANDSFIATGTGNDSIDGNLMYNPSGSSGSEVVGGKIYYDNKGQDTIRLNEYREGMISDAKGNTKDANDEYLALSTGTDGGQIELERWTSGQISFGNGHDTFVLYNHLSNKGEVAFFQGNDNIYISGNIDANSSISYDNRGQDSIEFNTYTGAEIKNTYGSDSALSTGIDGGSISLGYWTTGGSINFGKGNDAFTLQSGTVFENIDLSTGKDSIDVAVLNTDAAADKNILYNNDNFDSITIRDTYEGKGIAAQDGKLSTGAGGGYIHVDNITSEGIQNLAFNTGNVNEAFTIGTLRSNNNEGTIDLGQGVDTIIVMTIGDAANGIATIKYNNVGFDSIAIQGEYKGEGIEDQNGKLSTGTDGGFIHVGAITTEAGVDGLEFSAKNDTFEIGILNVAGEDSITTINLNAGNDIVKVHTLTDGTINLGDGNNTITVTAEVAAGGIIEANSGADTFDIASLAGKIIAGSGNNKIIVDTVATGGEIRGGGNVDNITITTQEEDSKVIADYGNDSLSLGDIRGTVYGDAESAILVTSFTTGADKFIIDSLHDTATIYGDSGSIDANEANKFTIKGGNDVITVNGDITGTDVDNVVTIIGDMGSIEDAKTFTAGNDNITLKGNVQFAEISTDSQNTPTNTDENTTTINGGIDTVTLGIKGQEGQTSVTNTTINLGHGNDVLTAYSTLGAGNTINGDAGNDRMTIHEIQAGTINGGVGIDSITIAIMSDSATANGEGGNDTFKITTMTGGTVDGGADNDTFNITTVSGAAQINGGIGDNTYTIGHMIGGTVQGGITGSDNVKITTMDGGIVNTGYAKDTINITNFNGGTINGGTSIGQSFTDTFIITNMQNGATLTGGDVNNIKVTNMYGGSIIGGTYSDTINITTATGGEIEAGASDDIIKITGTAQNIEIDGEGGNDNISVTTGIGNEVSSGFRIEAGEGNDTITMTTLNRGRIEGGTAVLDNGIYGTDSITVKNVYNSSIYGDERFDDGSDNTVSYNDIIKVTGTADATDIAGGFGNDTINVTNLSHASFIEGQDGDDSITVTTLTNSSIDGGAGDDSITVTSINGTLLLNSIDGGAGDDSITITSLSGHNIIYGGSGDDTINITTTKQSIFGNSLVYSDDGDDSIIIKTMTNGLIVNASGNDTIEMGTANTVEIVLNGVDHHSVNIGTATDVEIRADEGNDSIKITNSVRSEVDAGVGDDTIAVGIKGNSNSLLTGGYDADDFIITGARNSSITITDFTYNDDASLSDSIFVNGKDVTTDAKAAQDALQNAFTTKDGVTIYLGNVAGTDGNDTINLTNLITPNFPVGTNANIEDALNVIAKGASNPLDSLTSVEGKNGADDITVANAEYAAIYGGYQDGSDDMANKITITNSKLSLISGGALADSITINNAIGSSVRTYTGADTVTITKQLASSLIVSNSGDEVDTLYLNGNMGSKTNITLEAENAGFIVAKSYNEDFDYHESLNASGGTLNGSNGADTFHLGTISSATLNGGSGDDVFNTLTMNSGNLNGGSGDDVFNTLTMNSGNLNGNAGNDLLTIMDLNGGKVDGGEGVDTVHINLGINKAVSIANSGAKQDTIGLNSGIVAGGTLNLTSDAGFYMTSEYGDVGFLMNAGTINGSNGADDFFVREIKGGTINGGGGADNFLLASALGGTVDGGVGADTVTISNELVKSFSVKNTGFEADTLFLTDGLATGAKLSLTSNAGFTVARKYDVDNDIYAGFYMNGGSLTGSAGNDSIYVHGLGSNAVLNGGAGNDLFNVVAADGATIDGGTGVDTINFGLDTIPKLSINNTSNTQDFIWLDFGFNAGELSLSGSGGFVLTTSSRDSFDMGGGTITGSSGNDYFSIESMTGGSINAGSGNDKFDIFHMTGGSINAGSGNDSILVFGYEGGSIDSGTGADSILFIFEISEELNITNSGKEQDILTFTNYIEDGANITLAGVGSFNVSGFGDGFDMSGGTLTGSAAADRFNINNMTGGIINGAAGNDNFIVTNLEVGTINGDAGNDVFTISSMQDGTINGDAGNDTINLTLDGVADGSISGGTGADRFNITGTDGSVAYIVDLEKGDSLFINGKNVITDALKAQDAGDLFFTHDDVSIFFKQAPSIITETITTTVDRENNGSSVADLSLLGGIAENGELNLTGTGGFTVHNESAPFTMSGGTINGSDAIDIFTVSMTGGTINGGAGTNIFTASMNGGTLNGGDNWDTFLLSNIISGTINTGDDSDSISIMDAFNGSLNINGGAIGDTLTIVESMEQGAQLNLSGATGFDIQGQSGRFTMNGGSINGSVHNDYFNVLINGGSINAGAGNNTFSVQTTTESSGILIGGDGADQYFIQGEANSSIYIAGFDATNESDTLDINNNDVTSEAQAALDNGEAFFLHDGVTINFAQETTYTDLITEQVQTIHDAAYTQFLFVDAGIGENGELANFGYGDIVITSSDGTGVDMLADNSGIYADQGNDTILIDNMNGGKIITYAGDDFIQINNLQNGRIIGDNGNDTIIVNIDANTNHTIAEINLYGSETNADRIEINSDEEASISINLFEKDSGDTLFVNGVDVTDAASAHETGGQYTSDGITIYFHALLP